jgi:hypothetical protein
MTEEIMEVVTLFILNQKKNSKPLKLKELNPEIGLQLNLNRLYLNLLSISRTKDQFDHRARLGIILPKIEELTQMLLII